MVASQQMTQEQANKVALLTGDLRFFAANNLFIKGKKAGAPFKLVFNTVQEYLHHRIEDMKRRTGWVRVIIVKARQQTCSTYITGRFFHKAVTVPGTNVYILTHEADATATLFGKVALYNEMLPTQIKPGLEADNRTTLAFSNKSEYKVGTAGSANTGRSKTAQYMHFSEPAHVPDEAVAQLDTGVMQIVSDDLGSEIIYETTANGMNWFYKFTFDSLAGLTDYEVIFVPWFWTPEYRRAVEPGFKCDEYELKLKARFGLDDAQIHWRRRKIVSFSKNCSPSQALKKFMQEYPATLQEAFQASGEGFFNMERVRSAMNSKVQGKVGALILGVDSGGDGKTADRTVLALRRGRELIRMWKYTGMNDIRLAGIVSNLIEQYKIDKVCIDKGYGKTAVDLLRERHYYEVEGVSFAESADSDEYANKRAEMAYRFQEWLCQGDEGEVNLPDDEEMAADIACMPEPEQNGQGRWVFPKKKDIKKKIGRSPDILDAIMLTFARNVRGSDEVRQNTQRSENMRHGSEFLTLTRRRNATGGTVKDQTVPKEFSFKRNSGKWAQ